MVIAIDKDFIFCWGLLVVGIISVCSFVLVLVWGWGLGFCVKGGLFVFLRNLVQSGKRLWILVGGIGY